MMKDILGIDGFTWNISIVDENGDEKDSETKKNLIPAEGLDFLIRTPFGDVGSISTFYLGLFRGNYIPSPSTSAADIPNGMIEFVDYSEASRPEWVRQLESVGAMDNFSQKAKYTVTQDRTIYGAFLVSNATKGSNNGLILSCVRFATPKHLTAGQKVELSGGLTYKSTNTI